MKRLCLLFLLFALVLPASAAKKPNFVFFLVDDLGWKDLGCFGSSFYDTPNIDKLAASGMKFTHAYASCPVCSPTRASIMTGRYPSRTRITTFIGAAQPEKWRRDTALLPAPYQEQLALEELTMAEALKEAGYATFFAGKWHLGKEGFWPEDQGFDVNKGGHSRGGPYGGKKYFSPYGNPRLSDGPEGEHLPDRLATETTGFIEANQDQPFLAYLSFYSVHTPLISREDLRKKYAEKAKGLPERITWGREGGRRNRLVQDHAIYGGMVEAMDAAVGKVLDRLEALGLADDTVVVFTSDNGGLSTSEGHPTSNLPLRGGKGWIYEGGIREPTLVRWPGVTQPGSVCETPITSTDYFPTFLEMAGLPARPERHVDGMSFVSLLKGEPLDRGPLFWHFPHYGNQGGPPSGAVREGDWKLIRRYENDALELYNMNEDPGESHNVVGAEMAKRDELKAKLDAFLEESGAIFPTPNPRWSAEGAERVRLMNYPDCIRLFNGETEAILGHHVGGRVLKYARNGVDALYLSPEEADWEPRAKKKPSSAGRFDIGPEYLVPRHERLWSGPWKAEVIGPRAARMTSVKDPRTGVQLVREFHLAAEGTHLCCRQTIINISEKTQYWCHWSRTFALHGGIGIVPLTQEQSKFPNGYVRMEKRGQMNIRPEDPNIRERDGFLEILAPPAFPKLGFDSMATWCGYQMPNDHLFVKRYQTYPGRAYNEVAGLTLSIWYPKADFIPACEIEPIGPQNDLEPGEKASFTEHWYLLENPFPGQGEQLDLKGIAARVDALGALPSE
ncbi:MAG: sulfatase-like hydrolase/transferase [Verrucomicrobiota bacterium]